MAGRGSRFSRQGAVLPKPLMDLEGKPFFWWATESVRRSAPVRECVFVVLDEHIATFGIREQIHAFYPDATVVGIPDVTSGAAETAAIGVRALKTRGPVAINDSDHAFSCPAILGIAGALRDEIDAALLCFHSDDPAYSYARLAETGRVLGTVEKKVVSPLAIAGCYLFSGPELFFSLYEQYLKECPYDELFLSGLYNQLAAREGRIATAIASRHFSFGTPEELAALDRRPFHSDGDWLA